MFTLRTSSQALKASTRYVIPLRRLYHQHHHQSMTSQPALLCRRDRENLLWDQLACAAVIGQFSEDKTRNG